MKLKNSNAPKPIVVVHIVTTARTLLILNDHMNAMEHAGIEYHVLANFAGTSYKPDGRQLHQIGLRRNLISIHDLVGFFSIRKQLKALNPGTIIVSTPKAGLIGGLAAYMFCRKSNRIFLVRGFRFPTMRGFKRFLVQHLEILPSRFCGKILGTSKQTADTLRNHLPDKFKQRVGVTLNGTANGIDMDAFSPDNKELSSSELVRARYGISPDAFVVLVVARVCVDKGYIELTKAFEQLKEKYPHVVLLVVGDDDFPDPLPREIQETLDSISVRAGRISNQLMPEVYRSADVLVYPSRREGFGISAIEAAAMGTPTIASKVGGLKSAVKENVTGVFHEVGDVDGIEGHLSYFIDHPEELSALGRSAHNYVKGKYDRKLYDKFWLDIYQTEG